MSRKKYKVTVKMIKEINMNHEQESMQLAIEDVKNLINKSSDENINKMFNTAPKFIYRVKII